MTVPPWISALPAAVPVTVPATAAVSGASSDPAGAGTAGQGFGKLMGILLARGGATPDAAGNRGELDVPATGAPPVSPAPHLPSTPAGDPATGRLPTVVRSAVDTSSPGAGSTDPADGDAATTDTATGDAAAGDATTGDATAGDAGPTQASSPLPAAGTPPATAATVTVVPAAAAPAAVTPAAAIPAAAIPAAVTGAPVTSAAAVPVAAVPGPAPAGDALGASAAAAAEAVAPSPADRHIMEATTTTGPAAPRDHGGGRFPTNGTAAPGHDGARATSLTILGDDAGDGGTRAVSITHRAGTAVDGTGPAATTPPSTVTAAQPPVGTQGSGAAAPVGTPAGAASSVPGQVFPQVARLVTRGDGTQRLTLRLSPEDLGDVRIVVTVRDGAVDVSLAAGADAQEALRNGSPELRRLLESVGAVSTQIAVRDLPMASTATAQSSGGGPAHPDAGASGGHGRHDRTGDHRQHTTTPAGSDAAAMSPTRPGDHPNPAPPAGVDLRL